MTAQIRVTCREYKILLTDIFSVNIKLCHPQDGPVRDGILTEMHDVGKLKIDKFMLQEVKAQYFVLPTALFCIPLFRKWNLKK